MPCRAGFTLLEICLAVAIALLLVTVAVPSIRAVFTQQRLRRTADAFDKLAMTAQQRSVEERRTYAVVWEQTSIQVRPMERQEEVSEGTLPSLPRSREQDYVLDRPAAFLKNPPPVWTFWRSGVCEPVVVTYSGPEGTWKAEYEALSGRRKMVEEEAK